MDFDNTYSGVTAETPEQIEVDQPGVVRRWLLELKLADKREKEWRRAVEKILNRYRQRNKKANQFNILWANTETMRPAIYNSLPSPDVRRRFDDADPLGKCVSDVIDRSLQYQIETSDFDKVMEKVVLDLLLPGRGLARVRYIPSFKQIGITPDTPEEDEDDPNESMEGYDEELEWEQASAEHVQWDDFRMGPGKEWNEVSWIAFRHPLSRDELNEQFGEEIGSQVQLDNTDDQEVKAENSIKLQELFKTAEVWEIWDKDEKEVLFIANGYKAGPLKTLPDPLNLDGFWPIPEPIYAIEDSNSLVPCSLYTQYEEQAKELDTITARINQIVKGLKLRGIYDATLSELSELMRGEDNDLIPAQNVTALLERGGIEKAVWMWPVETAANVLKVLYEQREQTKQTIYELTGISDIIRGATDPRETAAAQGIKHQWGTMRLQRLQREMARFVRDLMRLQGEIISEKFSIETIQTMTGLNYPTMQMKQQAMMQYQQQAQMAQMQGQPVPPQPQFPPTWEEVIQVMKEDAKRTFKVDIETDSTIAATIDTDMSALQGLLQGIAQVIQGFEPAVAAGAVPVDAVKEIILAVVRRARLGNAVEDALQKITQPPPKGDPEAAKAQAQAQLEMQKMQMQSQLDEKQANMEAQLELHKQSLQAQQVSQQNQIEAQREQMQSDNDAKLELLKLGSQKDIQAMQGQLQMLIALIGAKSKIDVAEIAANTALTTQQAQAADEGADEGTDDLLEAKPDPIEKLADMHRQSLDKMTELLTAVTKPKRVIRGPDGKIQGVE